jgi:hypothetical protein
MKTALPPRSCMPTSNVKRVRSESFSKIIRETLAASTLVYARGRP